jgi:hypothetical protein
VRELEPRRGKRQTVALFDRVAIDRVAIDRVAIDRVAIDRVAYSTGSRIRPGRVFDRVALLDRCNEQQNESDHCDQRMDVHHRFRQKLAFLLEPQI